VGLDIDAITDAIATTLKALPDDQYEIMWDSHSYEITQVLTENRRSIDAGTTIQRNVMLDRHGRARFRRMFDTDHPTVDQNQHTIDVPFAYFSTDYSWDEVELLVNRKPAGFINYIQSRKAERMWDLAELIEERGWSAPTSATDKLYPYGIPYYVNYLDNGSTTGGFHAKTIRYQNGTTGTICAGIDAGAEAKWRNYADVYTKVDNSLLIKLRQAVRRTRFKPAPNVQSKGDDKVGSPIKLYANDEVVTELETLADSRDDNNTPGDLAGKVLYNRDGATQFNKLPIMHIDQLDGETVTDGAGASFSPNSIICVDWTKLQPVVRDGYWMVEKKPQTDRGQHTTFTVYLDGSVNFLAVNRRTLGFRLHRPIPGA
jgi:hypothetical protein